jgi:hypothetical protein
MPDHAIQHFRANRGLLGSHYFAMGLVVTGRGCPPLIPPAGSLPKPSDQRRLIIPKFSDLGGNCPLHAEGVAGGISFVLARDGCCSGNGVRFRNRRPSGIDLPVSALLRSMQHNERVLSARSGLHSLQLQPAIRSERISAARTGQIDLLGTHVLSCTVVGR